MSAASSSPAELARPRSECDARAAAPIALTESDPVFLSNLGRRVREARAQRGMARKALSREANVSERYLAQLEAGEGNVTVVLLRRVAAALGLRILDLLDQGSGVSEQRLIRRFLDALPAERLQEVLRRLTTEFGQDESMRRKRITLLGLRGAGKSTLGEALARSLRRPLVELDKEIEREAGIGLSEIFLLYGQAGYRRIERRCLERIVESNGEMVMTVGGGIVSEPETYNLLLHNCLTVWVKASPDEHMGRVVAQGDFRPMQGHAEAMEDLTRILEARVPLYRKADLTIDTTGETPAQSLRKLREAVAA